MKTKTKILITLGTLSIALNIGLICKSITLDKEAKSKTARIGNVYEESLSLVSQHCYDLEHDLSKLTACSQPEEAIRILTDVVDDSGSAVASLSLLPLYPEYVNKLNRYLNHVSDYSKFVISECSSGKDISDDCRNNIASFASSSAAINKVLTELSDKLRDSPFDWSTLMNEELSASELFDNELSSSMEEIQNNGIDYPTLIYDGPFSDSVVNKKITEDGTLQLTKDEAVTLLCGFIGTNGSFSVKDHTLCNGSIDTWAITLEESGRYYYGNVSVKSGKIISFITDGGSNSENLTRDEAVKCAGDFLSSRGYDNMVPQYCQIADGNATVNFVYSENGILFYPDMVKVRVDMENGTVNGFEGLSYYINHTENRDKEFPAEHSFEDAALLLPEKSEVLSSSKAVIPTDGGNELSAYEYRIKVGSDTFVIYFDAKNLKEVKIFKILYSENGEFVV